MYIGGERELGRDWEERKQRRGGKDDEGEKLKIKRKHLLQG